MTGSTPSSSMPRRHPTGKQNQTANCTLLRMPRRPRRRRPSTNDSMHNVEAAMSKPLPEIESDETRAVLADYLEEVRQLADRVVPGTLRISLRRHVIALERRIAEYDAQQGDA